MPDITSNLIYHLPMNDDAASTTLVPAVDINGDGNSTLVGANSEDITETDLDGNKFLHLNGSSQYIDLPDLSAAAQDNMSMTCWWKYDAQTPPLGNQAYHFNLGPTGAFQDNNVPWTDGLGYFAVFRNDPSLGANKINSVTMPADDRTQWFHMAFTTKPGADGWNFYINGNVVHTTTGVTNLSLGAGATPEFRLGRGRTGTISHVDGSLRDFRLYGRTLTADDIGAFTGGILGENATPIQNPYNFSDFE